MTEAKNIEEVENQIKEINDSIQNSDITDPDEMAVEFIKRLEDFKASQDWEDEQAAVIEKQILLLNNYLLS